MKTFVRIIVIVLISLVSVLGTLFFLKHQEPANDEIEIKKKGEVVVQKEKNINSPLNFNDFSKIIYDISSDAEESILWINANDADETFGTGFVISFNDEDYVLTNYHVIESSNHITAYLNDDEEVTLEIIGFDKDSDLAILSFEDEIRIQPLSVELKKDPKIGDFVLVIGHPLGLDYTSTFGIVSAINRELDLEEFYLENLIQVDAAINPGNSGGPLFNIDGKVIGINVAMMEDSQGLGFAIPISDVYEILDELIENGAIEKPFLGVTMLETEGSVAIDSILKNSPSEKAGLYEKDIILEINGIEIDSINKVKKIIETHNVGDSIDITLNRNGDIVDKTVQLVDKKEVIE